MRFNMTKPCKNCPFRLDTPGYLTPKRAEQIAESLLRHQQTFACHKTIDYEGDGKGHETGQTQHCAGALIFCEAHNLPNQLMRIAERLGYYKYCQLDMDSPVAKTTEEFVKHHGKSRTTPNRL